MRPSMGKDAALAQKWVKEKWPSALDRRWKWKNMILPAQIACLSCALPYTTTPLAAHSAQEASRLHESAVAEGLLSTRTSPAHNCVLPRLPEEFCSEFRTD